MADYVFRGVSPVHTYNVPGVAVVSQLVDIPALIADPAQLALKATPNDPLTVFAGLAQNDTISVAIPACLVKDFGLYCSTREDGSSGDVDCSLKAANITFSIVAGGAGSAKESAYNPIDENDDPNYPIVNIGEVLIDPVAPASVLPRHSYYGDNYLTFTNLGAKTLTTAVFQIALDGVVTFS